MQRDGQLKIKNLLIYSLLLTFVILPFQNCSRSGFDTVGQSSSGLNGPSSTLTPRNVKIAWDKSTSAGVQGYKVYVGTKAGVYDQNFDAGPTANPDAPQYELTNLDLKTTYFVVVKAYDQASESSASNELQIPGQ